MPSRNKRKSLPGPTTAHPYNLSQAMARFESNYLFNILELTRWDCAKASLMLCIDIDLLAEKIRNYGLSPENLLS